jgi:hypothetical protein
MGAIMVQELEDFGTLARRWKPFFMMRTRVALAMREDDGWHLWYSYTAFLSELPANHEPLNVETRSVRAFRELMPLPNVGSAELAIAEVLEKPGAVGVGTWKADLAPSNPNLSFEYEPLHLNRFAGPKRLPALTAQWHNPNYRTLASTKELDQELQLHESPYDGFADLAAALNIPVGLDDLNRRRFSEFVLIPPVELLFHVASEPHSELTNGELSLVFKAHPEFPTDKLRLGLKAYSELQQSSRGRRAGNLYKSPQRGNCNALGHRSNFQNCCRDPRKHP